MIRKHPRTALFQGRLASSHAKRAKSDRVSVWAREKERESGGEIVTERNKKKESVRDREDRSREREKNKLESEMLVARLIFRLSV